MKISVMDVVHLLASLHYVAMDIVDDGDEVTATELVDLRNRLLGLVEGSSTPDDFELTVE